MFIDSFLDAKAPGRLNTALETERAAIRSGTSALPENHMHLSPECGRFRHYQLHERIPESLVFRDHPVLLDLVRAYLGDNEQFVQLALEMRQQPPDWEDALSDLQPHMDSYIRELKIYLALEDITDDNGPIVYWTGTHRRGEWRKVPDYISAISGFFVSLRSDL